MRRSVDCAMFRAAKHSRCKSPLQSVQPAGDDRFRDASGGLGLKGLRVRGVNFYKKCSRAKKIAPAAQNPTFPRTPQLGTPPPRTADPPT